MSGSIFSDPTTAGLMGMAQGFAQAAMPSRMPVPFGAAIGMGGAGAMRGVQDAEQMQLQQEHIRAAQLANAFTSAMQPAKIQAYQAAFGGAPFGTPQSEQQGTGPQAPDAQQPAQQQPSLPMDPGSAAIRQLEAQARAEFLGGDGRSSAATQGRIQQAVTSGMINGADGQVYAVPNATRLIYAQKFSEGAGSAEGALHAKQAEAKYGADLARDTYAANAGVETSQVGPRALAAAQNEPATMIGPDPANPGSFRTFYTDKATAAGKGQQPAPMPTASMSALPDSLKAPFMNAMLAKNIPPPAWPFAAAMVAQESSFNPANPGGLGSITPGTAKEFGLDYGRLSKDPAYALMGMATVYADKLQKAGGDPIKGAGLYGPGTPEYVQSIIARVNGAQRGVGTAPVSGTPGMPVFTPGQEESQKADAQRVQAVQTEVLSNAKEGQFALQRAQQVEQALAAAAKSGQVSGYFSPELAHAVAAAKSLGIDTSAFGIDPKSVASQQVATEGLKQINGALMKFIFPQRITNIDLKTFGEALPNYGMDPAAIGQLLGVAKSQAQYEVDKANSLMQYKGQRGVLDAGWEPQFYAAKGYGPTFFDALKAAPAANAATASPQAAPAPQQAAPNAIHVPLMSDGKTIDPTKLVNGQLYQLKQGARHWDAKQNGFVAP